MQPGDRLIIYHTGDEKERRRHHAAVVSVDASDPQKSPNQKSKPGKPISKPVSLAEVKIE